MWVVRGWRLSQMMSCKEPEVHRVWMIKYNRSQRIVLGGIEVIRNVLCPEGILGGVND